MDVRKAWQKFISSIEDIRLRQNNTICRFLDEIARRQAERIRNKIKKI